MFVYRKSKVEKNKDKECLLILHLLQKKYLPVCAETS